MDVSGGQIVSIYWVYCKLRIYLDLFTFKGITGDGVRITISKL